MRKILLIAALSIVPKVWADPLPACEHYLKADVSTGTLAIDDQWEAILDMAGLSTSEKPHVRSFMGFFLQSYELRASKRPLTSLRSAFVTEQGLLLRDVIQGMITAWDTHLQSTDVVFDQRLRQLEADIRRDEMEIRTGQFKRPVVKGPSAVESVLAYAGARAGVVKEISGALGEAGELIRSNPERQLFEAKRNLVKLREDIRVYKTAMIERAGTIHELLLALRDGLLNQLNSPDGLDFGTLYRFELAAAAVEDFAAHRFFVDTDPIGMHTNGFMTWYHLDLLHERDALIHWAKNPGFPTEIREIDWLVETADLNLAEHGFVTLPLMRPLSMEEALALAFLPVRPVRFHLQPTEVNSNESSASGARVTLEDLSVGTTTQGYGVEMLNSSNPQLWAQALSDSWWNWYLMLGGQLDATVGFHEARALPKAERAARWILFSGRYANHDESSTNWASGAAVADWIYNKYLFIEGMPSIFANPGVVQPAGSRFDELDLAAGLDLMLARLRRRPDFELDDPNLRAALKRFPLNAVSAKLSGIKPIFHESPAPGPSGGS